MTIKFLGQLSENRELVVRQIVYGGEVYSGTIEIPEEVCRLSTRIGVALDGQFVPVPDALRASGVFNPQTGAWGVDLAAAKTRQTAAINAACRAAIVGGFTSAALGTPHVYDSEETDQANLTGQRQRAAITGQAQLYKCQDVATGVKDWRLHAPEQLDQVFLDGAAFKETQLVKATLLKQQIAQAQTLEEILAVVW